MSEIDLLSRRRFLRQSFAFSALAGMGALPSFAATSAGSTNLLMVGDWGAEGPKDQARVAAGMQSYVKAQKLKTDALLMLGDNWYGPLPEGAKDKRWQTQFEDMYPQSVFDCTAYAIPGNHDYQRMPLSKLDAELEYAKSGKTRWTMPSRWYSFEFPAKNPLMKVIALDSNMPHEDGKWDFGDELYADPGGSDGTIGVADGGAGEAADDAMVGSDGASPGLLEWPAWGYSDAGAGLGATTPEAQGASVPRRP